ncbi:MAG: hypothetical protein IPP17_29920 [Bacteroidetes bacterium]|nr:hypothetical protein [Bacteroidota bacterium]
MREVTFQIVETTNYSIDQYLKAIRSAQTDKRPDLAIIEIPNEFRNMPDNSNPYFQLKAKLLSQEIPVQFVTTGTVLKPNEYILNSLGLQIYAKWAVHHGFYHPRIQSTKNLLLESDIVGFGTTHLAAVSKKRL